MELLRQVGQCLHDALHVYNHDLDSARQDGQLLMQEVTRRGHPLAHQRFVAGAADTCQSDPLSTLLLGISQELRILNSSQNHLRQRRLVAVDNNVDFVLL